MRSYSRKKQPLSVGRSGLYLHSNGYYYWRRTHPLSGKRIGKSTGQSRVELALRVAARLDEELDKEARNRLKNLREGTPEWEIEYPRVVAALKRQKGLV